MTPVSACYYYQFLMRIVLLGESILRDISEPITDINQEIRNLVDEMLETMYSHKGIGLAAVQVGRLIRMFITHAQDDEPRVFINPAIVETSLEEWKYEEGCLSIPGVNADVVRPSAISIQARNEHGRRFKMEADGILARVILHELDHLNGVLFIDKLSSKRRDRLLKNYDPEESAV